MEDIKSKFIIAGKKVIELRCSTDGLWLDDKGTVYALADDCASVDPAVRCGVGMASIPYLGDACRAHDYAYSSPAYQIFHNRSEADAMLENQIEQFTDGALYGTVVGKTFRWLSRIFGGAFWENKETRNK